MLTQPPPTVRLQMCYLSMLCGMFRYPVFIFMECNLYKINFKLRHIRRHTNSYKVFTDPLSAENVAQV